MKPCCAFRLLYIPESSVADSRRILLFAPTAVTTASFTACGQAFNGLAFVHTLRLKKDRLLYIIPLYRLGCTM